MEIPDKFLQYIHPTGLNSKFDYENLSFPAYIATINGMLKSVNEKLQLGQTDAIINGNTPFELRPKQPTKKGALLIHGLFDTPFIMRDVGKHLVQQDLLVRSILLPGHGTIPADLLTTSPKEWYKATQYAIQSFANEVDELYLVGFSTGAALELNYVLQHSPKQPNIAGLIMLCPALALNTKKSIFLRAYRMIRWAFKQQKWIFRRDNSDYAKYTSFPVNSGYLVQRIIIENNLLLKKHACSVPLFIAMSEDDETVRTSVALKFFQTTSNPLNQFVLYSNTAPTFSDSRINIVTSAKPSEHVLNLSHISLINAPDNPHYGQQGDYQSPLTEPDQRPLNKIIHYGATTPENENHFRLRRLTYNPFFNELMQSIDRFIASTSV